MKKITNFYEFMQFIKKYYDLIKDVNDINMPETTAIFCDGTLSSYELYIAAFYKNVFIKITDVENTPFKKIKIINKLL